MTSQSIRSNSDIPKSQQADNVCPGTPTPTSPKKRYQRSPNRSPNKAREHRKSQQADDMCSGTPTPTSPRKKQINPNPSPNKANKHGKSLQADHLCPDTPTSPKKKTYQINPSPSPNKANKHGKSLQADHMCPVTPTSPRKKTYQINPNPSPNKASKSQQADLLCPVTPISPRKKTYQMNPSPSPNKASSKHNKELKVLTNLVQGLAQKLKKTDTKVQQVREEADKLNEVTLRLESTNKSIADAAAQNQTLSRRVKNLQSTIDMEGGLESDLESAEDTTPTSREVAVDDISKRLKREEEFHQLETQCTYAAVKEKEKEGVLAKSQAETEELRFQLATLTSLLRDQNRGSSSVPESPRPSLLSSPSKHMKRLSDLLKSPKKIPKCAPLL